LKGGAHWVSWGGRDPLFEFLQGVREIYADFERRLNEEMAAAFRTAELRDGEIRFAEEERFERGATWTYLTTDQPFGTLGERAMRGLRRKFLRR
jgi:preprotein translocase subunit SecA